MPLVINGQIIPDQVLHDEVLRLSSGLEMPDAPEAGGMNPAALQSFAVRNVVGRTLLLQQAVLRGLRVTEREAEQERQRRWGSTHNTACGPGVREAIVEDLLVQRVTDDLTRHVPRPGRVECEEAYHRNRQSYWQPAAIRVAHIVCNIESEDHAATAHQTMQSAEAELAKGNPFAQVADRYSDCKGVGGLLGWITRGQMVEEFDDVVFALAPKQRSGIFRTTFGLHIATVLQQRNQGYRPFEEVRFDIARRMLDDRRGSALAQVVAAMEQRAIIAYQQEDPHA